MYSNRTLLILIKGDFGELRFRTLNECEKCYSKDQLVILCNVKQIMFYACMGCQPLLLWKGYNDRLIAIYDKNDTQNAWNNWRSKPIKCIDFDKYYHDAKVFISSYFQEYGEMVDYNSILDTCHGKYKQAHNLHFQFISREEFNKIKSESPEKVVGEYFTLAS